MNMHTLTPQQAFAEGLSTGSKNASEKGKRLIITHIGSDDRSNAIAYSLADRIELLATNARTALLWLARRIPRRPDAFLTK
ncbi:hypothetical protein Trydic_g23817 [Trypoxylus dichotomus]